jgi:myo-inositol-1(or 4)-monophosphatase
MHPLINIGTKAARRAGQMIYRAMDNLDQVKVSEKGHNDFVSNIDKRSEMMIIETIHEAYPNHAILAEESGEHEGSDVTWIIDPLDGTKNFIYGIPQFAVSIAVKENNRIQHGIVFDPVKNELFTASRGAGAALNDTRIRVNQTRSLATSLIGTGFPYREHDNLDQYMAIFKDIMRQCRDIRRPGSAALDLCYVAAGRYDGFYEFNLNIWDIAAGALIVEEAGGIVDDVTGKQAHLTTGNIVAAAPKLFPELIKTIRPHL